MHMHRHMHRYMHRHQYVDSVDVVFVARKGRRGGKGRAGVWGALATCNKARRVYLESAKACEGREVQ